MLGQHLGTSTQASQADTVKPVGLLQTTRLQGPKPGHKGHWDLVLILLDAIDGRAPFLLRSIAILIVFFHQLGPTGPSWS